MPSLKEIKGRIASVSGTLKITSAMKMVASAKLHKAQLAIGNMLPYEKYLHRILVDLMDSLSPEDKEGEQTPDVTASLTEVRKVRHVALVAFSSNSSLCGAFNSNVVREAVSVVNEYRSAGLGDQDITVYSVGRKVTDAFRRLGFKSPADYTALAESPSYEAASALASELEEGFLKKRFDKVELVYNHYKSTASQPTARKTYLPISLDDAPDDLNAGKASSSSNEEMPEVKNPDDMIIEPDSRTLVGILLPKVLRLRIFTTLLDSNAAEHAARTVAMQNATDNGEDLLQDLTLEYNKGRQQKITSEILDIVGGSLQ